ncbi:enoyl-CoA hydratase/carnithine racemase [Mucilaginibacter gracilis]|uniref:Enoyl-CoA hydratase/carnithine racemase n=1 Tax=Mucilaginibacter gracilis TaxID=423350 RepID=A0A495IVP1_9SPHI|nr:enoyl-CoA hydratase/isomerase family protein [Mucilaginibacter gracilis]RKR80816.1 enoyl-CoA hydratase/carnithine racemase [Mucilaginibacter gracilis]
MNTIQVTIKDRLAVIALNRGKSNPMNAEMVKELHTLVHSIDNDDNIGGLIITGKENFFSAGLDLIELYDYNEEQITAFWTDFLALQAKLVSFKKPMVAAISGHSPAGGCVIAICCDYRVMAQGKYIIGLNEIPVGIIVPDSIFHLYSFWLGQRKAYQLLMEGKLLSVDEALQAGLIDEISNPESVISTAEKQIRKYMQLNPVTWSQSKLNLRKHLIAATNADQTETLNQMIKQWWAPETRKALDMIIQNLKTPRSPL